MAFKLNWTLLEGFLTATGLRGIQVPPRGSKARWHPRIIDVVDPGEYKQQLCIIDHTFRSVCLSFFISENCKKCLEMDDVVHKLVQANKELIVLRLNVDQPGVQEVMQDMEVPMLPTFYFYKAGDVVGRMLGSSAFKLEDLAVGFIHHKELRRHIRFNEF